MTKSRSTKRALLTSVLSLMLCAAMLIGSTFAWFTDTVASSKNRIVAGNLDVRLEWSQDGAAWSEVGLDTNLFMPTGGANATLWEPGHTEYAYIRISNAGSLALKYQFSVDVFGDEAGNPENEYTNAEGGKFMLSDYLVFNKADGIVDLTEGREKLWLTPEEELVQMGNLDRLGLSGELMPDGKAVDGKPTYKELTLAVYMPTQVGNAANQSAAAIEGAPTIYLGVTLAATQTPFENDGFGNDYDAEAYGMMNPAAHLEVLVADGYIPAETAADLRNALEGTAAPDGKVVMSKDVTVEDKVPITVLKDTVIDFNGNTLTGTIASGSDSEGTSPVKLVLSDPMNDGSKYTIDGAITPYSADFTHLACIAVWQPTVTIESGRYTHDNAIVHCQLNTAGAATSVIINGGTFDAKGAANVIYNAAGTVIINGGTFNANDSTTGNGGACFVLNAAKKNVPTITTINGGTFTDDSCMFLIAPQEGYTQKLEVNGGTFILDDPGAELVLTFGGSAKGILEITGGTFNVDPSEYVDTAAYDVTFANGMWTVTAK